MVVPLFAGTRGQNHISSGHLWAFDLIGRKAREIVGHVTAETRLLGNEVSCLRPHRHFKASCLTQLIIVSLRKTPSHFALVINQSEK